MEQESDNSKERRLQDPQKVFADVAKPKSLPVQTLVRNQISIVKSVSEDGLSCVVEPSLSCHSPLHGPNGVLDTQVIDEDKVTFSTPPGLEQGDVISQKKFRGTKKEKNFGNHFGEDILIPRLIDGCPSLIFAGNIATP